MNIHKIGLLARRHSDPGPARPAGAWQALPASRPRLPRTQPATPQPASPVAGQTAGARLNLAASGVDTLDSMTGQRDPYDPILIEEFPSHDHSPELLDPAHHDVKGVIRVDQSEGASSARAALHTGHLRQCAGLLIVNRETGWAHLSHLDSGTRAMWPDAADGKRPVSPATPRRGLLWRDRFGLEAFLKQPGDKYALLVETEIGYDRREVLQQVVARGVTLLKPLVLELGSCPEDAVWHMAYRPQTDELLVHLEEVLGSSVMHFRGLMDHPQPAAGISDHKQADLADDLSGWKARFACADLDDESREIVATCLAFMELRNVNPVLAGKQFDRLVQLPGVPLDLMGDSIHPLEKDSPIVQVLTGLVDECLARAPG